MTTGRRQRVGILGGTFNPIHLGHLLIAQDAMEQAGLDRVKFIPAATPPHKAAPNLVDARHRVRMIKLAIAGHKRFGVDDIELRRGGKSYSVDTLTELKRRQPRVEWYFIIGTDSVPELYLWREMERLAKLCTFVAVARPGFDVIGPRPVSASKAPFKVRVVRGHACDFSSRDIRARVARKQSIRYLVPEAVSEYIEEQKLYR